MSCTSCYAMECIKEIRGANDYSEEGLTIMVGGIESVKDDNAYNLNLMKIDFARFRLKLRTIHEYKRKYRELSAPFMAMSYREFYGSCISAALSDMMTLIDEVANNISILENAINDRIIKYSTMGRDFKVTIPSNTINLENASTSPSAVQQMIQNMANYFKGISIVCSTKKCGGKCRVESALKNIPILQEPHIELPDGFILDKLSEPASTVDEIVSNVAELGLRIGSVIKQAQKIEAFIAHACEQLNIIQVDVKGMIDKLNSCIT